MGSSSSVYAFEERECRPHHQLGLDDENRASVFAHGPERRPTPSSKSDLAVSSTEPDDDSGFSSTRSQSSFVVRKLFTKEFFLLALFVCLATVFADCNFKEMVLKRNRLQNNGELEAVHGLYTVRSKRFNNGLADPYNNGRPHTLEQDECFADAITATDQIDDITYSTSSRTVGFRGTYCVSTKTENGGCGPYSAFLEFSHDCKIEAEHYFYDSAHSVNDFIAQRTAHCAL